MGTLIVAEFITVDGAAHSPGVPTPRVRSMSRCSSLAREVRVSRRVDGPSSMISGGSGPLEALATGHRPPGGV
jgi:hypothetical protein